MAYPNSNGGGKRRSTPGRKSAKKTANEDDDDGESEASETPTFGFVAYSNPGEKPWGKVKTSNHQPSNSNTPRSSRTLSLFPSPSSTSPSPKKIRCVDQRESLSEEKHEHYCKKRRANEGNPNIPLNFHLLG